MEGVRGGGIPSPPSPRGFFIKKTTFACKSWSNKTQQFGKMGHNYIKMVKNIMFYKKIVVQDQ